jgi:hypothetical protein
MESTLHKPAFVAGNAVPKATTILFWTFTALFCLEMSFTAYYELLPQGAQAFSRLGFTSGYFRWSFPWPSWRAWRCYSFPWSPRGASST